VVCDSVTVSRCHLRPSDKAHLAAVNAAQRAVAEQCAFQKHVTLLQVCCVEHSACPHTPTGGSVSHGTPYFLHPMLSHTVGPIRLQDGV